MKNLYVLILLVCISCTKNTKVKKDTVKDIAVDGLKKEVEPIKVKNTTVEDISGVYELINGKTYMIGSENFEIYKATIAIERLSETDFGFYSAYKRKDIAPIGDFGVLRNFKNNFYKLDICDEEDIEGYTKDNFTSGLYLHNKVIIHKKGDSLGIVQYGGNFRNYMLYKKKKKESNFYVSLVKTIKNAKLDYQKYLKKYEKAKNYDTNKLEIEHNLHDDVWKTKHHHKEDYASFYNTHSYQNPNQEGKFIKEDAVFKGQFKNSGFNNIINKIKVKSIPLVDTTNFDDFIEEEDYKKVDEKGLKLERVYPDFYKEGRNYRAIASYRLEFSKKFYTVVVTVLKGENEMESTLINYDFDGNIIDAKVISYDEIAEGAFQRKSKIEKEKITITYIEWMDEKKETIEVFEIKTDGKIEPVSQGETLIDNVIQQLGLNKLKIKEEFIVSKVQPHNPNETIVVIPEIEGDDDEHHFELNSHIVIVNSTTGKITHKYYESAETNGWDSDAIELSEIAIDTAPYMVSEDARAFGIRVYHYGRSKPNPYSNKTISLFVKSGNTLKKVLRHYDVMDYGGEWDTHCAGESISVKNTLIMSKEKTNTYFDIIVKSKITKSKTFVDEKGECDEENKITSKTTVLKFNGKEYLKNEK